MKLYTFTPLSDALKNSLNELRKSCSQFNTSDVLVNASADHNRLFFPGNSCLFPISDFPKKILKESINNQKESGIHTLCLAHGIVQLKIGGKRTQTPIVLYPLTYDLNKITEIISFEVKEDTFFLNPFLEIYLEEHFDIDLTEYSKISASQVFDFLKEKQFTIDSETKIIGNFHHHRFEILKELEELVQIDDFSDSQLPHLLGFVENSNENELLKLPQVNLFPSDTDHEKVYSSVEQGNLVIQGPPGTGKSQVLTNLIGKFLYLEKCILVLSEKRVALEVIQKKLQQVGLDHLSFIVSSERSSHSFLQNLKNSWFYFEQFQKKPDNRPYLSPQYEDNLQMTLDLLAQENLIGEVSYHHFHELAEGHNLADCLYSSDVPSIPQMEENWSNIQEIYSLGLQELIGAFKWQTIQQDNFNRLDIQIEKWLYSLEELNKLFSLTNWRDFSHAMKEAILCQIFENETFKKYASLFEPTSKANKQFQQFSKKWLKLQSELEAFHNQSEWITIPSEVETKSLLNSLKNSGFWQKRKLRYRWNKISHLPFHNAEDALHNRLVELSIKNKLSQLKVKFYDLGIEFPETDLVVIRQTLQMFSPEQWLALYTIPAERRQHITNHHKLLLQFYKDLKFHFHFYDDQHILNYLKSLQKKLSLIIGLKSILLDFNQEILQTLSRNHTITGFKTNVLKSHWVRFQERFPQFSKFEVMDLHDKVETILREQDHESNRFSQSIDQHIHEKFKAYHELLNTPSFKLNDDQKDFKKKLRSGKSLLVKEFKKSRNHPSLRELYHSDARYWIHLLKPICLINPVQLAKTFPLETTLFDVAIFDEASQIPRQNALGATHRAKRIIVAGDEQQMSPTSYFTTGSTDVIDLLHQASYQYPVVALKHHYRSAHPLLIAFSNQHFYENRLEAYPSYINNDNPIRSHYVVNGRFIGRRNSIEAKKVAQFIEEILPKDRNIGIVAFSEEQLQCIWEQLSPNSQALIESKIENDSIFFKTLENVQGDECDHLIISFGYGKDEENEFSMRFGPINTSSGRKRLNVLLTRAVQHIDFFHSVHASEFKLSKNESVNLLRKWFQFVETRPKESELKFPFNLNPTVEDNQLTFNKIQDTLPNAREIVTLHRILKDRGWDLHYK